MAGVLFVSERFPKEEKITMNIKIHIKHLLGWLRCLKSGVTYRGGVYIGKEVHFANGAHIKLGKNVSIRPYCDLFAGRVFEIGDNCDIGTRNRIAGNVIIGDNVLIGPDNFICSYTHTYDNPDMPIMNQKEVPIHKNGHEELKIGDGSWIGTHVAILGDVNIGKHCVIGANSVVTKDVPDYCVAVGSPAKVIKHIEEN